MTRTTASAAALLAAAAFLSAPARAAPVPPQSPGGRLPEYEAAERLFLRAGPAEPMAEVVDRWQYGGQRPDLALTLGSYARARRWLKVGAFYRVERGARHDDDWIRDSSGNWRWRDTFGRGESSLILDATPRVELPFLPGKSWVGSMKLRYEHDFFDGQSVLRVEPQLGWFWMNGLTPRATVFVRHEEVFPLNFGETTVWQRWTYLAALWHANENVSLGPSVALRDEYWSTSIDYKSFKGAGRSYQALYRAWVLGFTFVGRM